VIIGATKETYPGERRVGLVPASVAAIKKLGAEVCIEAGAGLHAGYPDAAYLQAGATTLTNRSEVIQRANILVQVRAAGANLEAGGSDLDQLRPGQVLLAQCDPLAQPQVMVSAASKQALVFALEMVPRISRAQSMDVLSSQATIAGYKAVLLAADRSPQMFPMMMTAAGTLTPERVFVVGAGVAGLQAIASARRMGAVVRAYDVRPAVKEQVESLGAKFVAVPLQAAEGQGGYAREMGEEFYRQQRELMLHVVAESDVVITTAAIPGKRAPILITTEMLNAMPAGSVVVDLAAERGGNCELTRAGEIVETGTVTILGPVNLAAEVPRHASQMYANNVVSFLKLLVKQGNLTLNLSDEILAGTLVTHQGRVVHPLVRQAAGLPEQLEPMITQSPAETSAPSEDDQTYRLQG
jgi:NAD(P) transhydrogenase subunit alpha